VHSRSFGVQSTINKARVVAFSQKWPMEFIRLRLLKEHPLGQRHVKNLCKDEIKKSDFRYDDRHPYDELHYRQGHARAGQIGDDGGHEHNGAHKKAQERHGKHPAKEKDAGYDPSRIGSVAENSMPRWLDETLYDQKHGYDGHDINNRLGENDAHPRDIFEAEKKDRRQEQTDNASYELGIDFSMHADPPCGLLFCS
jgi:hypothetical protein